MYSAPPSSRAGCLQVSLFEAMFERWVTDEAYWRKNRTFEMFREWFEVQMSSIVEDLFLDEPLGYME